jgi:hypothetical protein
VGVCGQNPWPTGSEPSLDELLSDSIAVALLRSDGLTRRRVEAVMARARRAMTRTAPRPPQPPAASLAAPREPGSARPRSWLEFDFDAEPELTLSES